MIDKYIVVRRKKGELKKLSTVAFLVFVFFIIIANAQNFSLNLTEDTNLTVVNTTFENKTFENTTISEESTYIKIQPIEENFSNDSQDFPNNSSITIPTIPIEANFSVNESAESLVENQSLDLEVPVNDSHKLNLPTENGTNSSEAEIIGILPLPDLNLELTYPSKITRGEAIEIAATVTNSGRKVKNLQLGYEAPAEMQGLEQEKYCGDLKSGDSCTFNIEIPTSTKTNLGISQIKVIASYKK